MIEHIKNWLVKILILVSVIIVLIIIYMSCCNLYATQKYRFVKSDGTLDVDMLERALERIENNYQPKAIRVFNHVPTKNEIGGEGYSVVYATCTQFCYEYKLINGTTYSFRLDKN